MVLSSRFDRIAAWAAGDDNDVNVTERIRSALRVYLASGGAISVERALGLPGREAARAYRLAERDFHLRQAARLLAGPDGTLSSAALAMACQRFLANLWPRWQAMATPPAGCSELHATLFAAARAAGGRLPTSLKQLGRIVDPLLMGLGPAALRDDARRLALDWDARRHWLECEASRLEFQNDFDRFRAWWHADAEGFVRFGYAADMVSDGDVQQGDPDSGNALTGDSHESAEPQCPTRKRSP